RDRERHVDTRAVLADAHRLEVRDRLSAPDAREHVDLFTQALGWDDQRDRAAGRLLCRVAEEALGAAIPRGDHPRERLADDGVLGAVDDGREPRVGLLQPAALSGVAEHDARALYRPSAILQR